jgi:thiosulfate/3-mercaptopyruvate sulfurtransferase
MLPSLTQFEQQISAMGIDNDDYVIAYDSQGVFSAARCWWMFRYFGHDRVSVLDGGLPAWLAQNLPVKTGNEKPKKSGKFYGKVRRDLLREITDMEQNVETKSAQVVDLRSRERYEGTMAEPWPGSGRGHIPGSVNLPYKTLLRPNGSMKGVEELQIKVKDMRLKMDKPIVASCGSGISACVAALAFYTMGKEDVAVYDGSWAEWGRKHKK